MMPTKFRRSASLAIPVFSAAAFLGLITTMLKVELNENLMQTGVTLSLILGILNIYMIYLVYKHQIP